MDKQGTKEKTKGVGGNGNLIPCKPGETHNPNGRPKGQRNFATIYRAALEKMAASQNMTPDEMEDLMLQSGIKGAFKDFRFYKDTQDRVHGPPKQDVGIGGVDGNATIQVEIKMI